MPAVVRAPFDAKWCCTFFDLDTNERFRQDAKDAGVSCTAVSEAEAQRSQRVAICFVRGCMDIVVDVRLRLYPEQRRRGIS